MLMLRVALANLLQTVPYQKLIVARRKDGRRHVHQNRDPWVAVVEGEGFATEEDCGDDARAEVTGQVGRDGVHGKAPDHGCVGEADGEGDRDGGDEGVGGVEAGPCASLSR